MKPNKIAFFLLLPAAFGLLAACSKERETPADTRQTRQANAWIEGMMRSDYLWYEDIPAAANLNYDADPSAFFTSLLSRQERGGRGGYYSTITHHATTKAYAGETKSYGFEFTMVSLVDAPNIYLARILYVLPGSPAAEAGLKRGDWISEIDGKNLIYYGQSALRSGGRAVLTLSEYVPETHSFKRAGSVSIGEARMVEDNPVFLDTVYHTGGRNIAYLVYNHFTRGPGGFYDISYDNDLRRAFARFKEEGADELVLDLRYNGGGYLVTAQLLATMIAPAANLGDVFCHSDYNGKRDPNRETTRFDAERIEGGANLDLQRLVVLTTSRTASASEAIVNGLRPFMEVTLIGAKTEGKNVGSLAYESTDWKIEPIVFRVRNKNEESDYAAGFVPDIPFYEQSSLVRTLPLGDENELMLRQAIDYLTTGSAGVNSLVKGREMLRIQEVYSSLSDKERNGLKGAPRRTND